MTVAYICPRCAAKKTFTGTDIDLDPGIGRPANSYVPVAAVDVLALAGKLVPLLTHQAIDLPAVQHLEGKTEFGVRQFIVKGGLEVRGFVIDFAVLAAQASAKAPLARQRVEIKFDTVFSAVAIDVGIVELFVVGVTQAQVGRLRQTTLQ